MKGKFFAVVGPLLLGCALFASSLGSAEEITTCGGAAQQAAAAPDIAISAELGQCGGKKAEKKDRLAYKVTNTGNVKLVNVRVVDERFEEVRCKKAVLAAGESMSCTASGPSERTASGMGGCAVADHVAVSEAGVLVTTKGDCTDAPPVRTTAMNR